MKAYKKLFCCGTGSSFRHVMAPNKKEAETLMGEEVRQPDSDDMRRIWVDNKLHEKDSEQIQAMFGITRQALSQWRMKAGADIPKYSDHRNEVLRDQIRKALDPSKTAAEIAEEVHTSTYTVKEVAEEEGVVLANHQVKKPDDDEIVRLSKGKTWPELAEACNVTVHTLQHYVYARPDLSEKIRKGIVYAPSGARSHGRVDVDRLLDLYAQGKTVYRISQEMSVQPMTVIYWLKKVGVYRGKEAKAVPQ